MHYRSSLFTLRCCCCRQDFKYKMLPSIRRPFQSGKSGSRKKTTWIISNSLSDHTTNVWWRRHKTSFAAFKAYLNKYLIKNGPTPGLFICLFSFFSNKQFNFFNKLMWKMPCPSSIRRRDLNPQPLEQVSSPITTRPGLPPYLNRYFEVLLRPFSSPCFVLRLLPLSFLCKQNSTPRPYTPWTRELPLVRR